MAYCDECGRSMPDNADKCPHCKAPVSEEKRSYYTQNNPTAVPPENIMIEQQKKLGESLKRIEELEKQQLKYQKSTTTNTTILAFFTLVSVIVSVMTYLQFAGMFHR